MNPETGEIGRYLSAEEAEAAGATVPLTEQEAKILQHVSAGRRSKALEAMRRPIPRRQPAGYQNRKARRSEAARLRRSR